MDLVNHAAGEDIATPGLLFGLDHFKATFLHTVLVRLGHHGPFAATLPMFGHRLSPFATLGDQKKHPPQGETFLLCF